MKTPHERRDARRRHDRVDGGGGLRDDRLLILLIPAEEVEGAMEGAMTADSLVHMRATIWWSHQALDARRVERAYCDEHSGDEHRAHTRRSTLAGTRHRQGFNANPVFCVSTDLRDK